MNEIFVAVILFLVVTRSLAILLILYLFQPSIHQLLPNFGFDKKTITNMVEWYFVNPPSTRAI